MTKKPFFFIIILIIIWWIIQSPIEHFGNPLHSTIHVRIDGCGNIYSGSFKPPSADGEYECTSITCPKNINDSYVC